MSFFSNSLLFSNTTFDKPGNDARKINQKRAVIRQLYFDFGATIPGLSKSIGLSVPSTTRLIKELIESKIVDETGENTTTGGRKAMVYRLHPQCAYVLVIQLNGETMIVTLHTILDEEVPGFRIVREVKGMQAEKVLHLALNDFFRLHPPSNSIIAVGIAMQGLTNNSAKTNFKYFPENGGNLETIVSNHLQVPVFVENDARAMAVGELVYGKLKGNQNAVFINLANGIGMGIVVGGRVYSGFNGFAGEFGHIQVESSDNLCTCGKFGCLETRVSADAICNRAANELKRGKATLLKMICKDKRVTTDDLVKAALMGDSLSIGLLNEAGLLLGKGLAIVIHLLNPEKIVLGGPLSAAGDFLLPSINQSLMQCAINKIRQETEIVTSALGSDLCLRGMSSLCIQELLG